MDDPRGRESGSGSRRSTVGGVGVFLAACAVCCAGPLLVLVGGVGALGAAAAFLVWPAVGLALAALTVAVVVALRGRRAAACRVDAGPTLVAVTRRPSAAASHDEVGDRR